MYRAGRGSPKTSPGGAVPPTSIPRDGRCSAYPPKARPRVAKTRDDHLSHAQAGVGAGLVDDEGVEAEFAQPNHPGLVDDVGGLVAHPMRAAGRTQPAVLARESDEHVEPAMVAVAAQETLRGIAEGEVVLERVDHVLRQRRRVGALGVTEEGGEVFGRRRAVRPKAEPLRRVVRRLRRALCRAHRPQRRWGTGASAPALRAPAVRYRPHRGAEGLSFPIRAVEKILWVRLGPYSPAAARGHALRQAE
jgi:hypothetical protein